MTIMNKMSLTLMAIGKKQLLFLNLISKIVDKACVKDRQQEAEYGSRYLTLFCS